MVVLSHFPPLRNQHSSFYFCSNRMTNDSKYIRWDHPDVEYGQGPEEDGLIEEICQLINESQKRVFNEHHHAFTGTHVKTHGVVKGMMEILPNLPNHLCQSMFADKKNSIYPVAIRFSTETSNLVPDHQPQPRGLGMKVFNVQGEKMSSKTDSKTQDFEFNSSPAIELGNAKVCKEILQLRLQYPDPQKHLEQLKKRDDFETQNARNQIPTKMLLTQIQYSQSAFRFGDYVGKFALFPTKDSAQMKSFSQDEVRKSEDGTTAHRERLNKFFLEEKNECTFDLKVQLLQNLQDQQIEDCRVEWSEEKYPFETIAKIHIPSQDPFLPGRINLWRDRIVMNPWNGRKDLQPLGSINRLRKKVYYASANFRRKMNGNLTSIDVQTIDQIPDE